MAKVGYFRLFTSEAVIAEASLIRDAFKREQVEQLIYETSDGITQLNDKAVKLAVEIQSAARVKGFFDALHISLASLEGCTYFLSCDDGLTGKGVIIEGVLRCLGYNIRIRDPINFLREMEV